VSGCTVLLEGLAFLLLTKSAEELFLCILLNLLFPKRRWVWLFWSHWGYTTLQLLTYDGTLCVSLLASVLFILSIYMTVTVSSSVSTAVNFYGLKRSSFVPACTDDWFTGFLELPFQKTVVDVRLIIFCKKTPCSFSLVYIYIYM